MAEWQIPKTIIEVDGVTFRSAPVFGGWYELDDPEPSGSVGRLMMPMLADGSPDLENVVEIEVPYEEA